MNGAPLFSAEADIVLPKGLSRERLCDALEAIAHDIMVDIVLRDASDPTAAERRDARLETADRPRDYSR